MAKAIKHKIYRPNSSSTSCGIARTESSVTRWEHVNCKRCLKKRAERLITHPRGNPTKWKPEYLDIIRNLKSQFYGELEIARALKIPTSTWYEWKQKHKLTECLQEGAELALNKAERSLYQRARGYKAKETKVFCYQGQIIEKEIVKEYPPEVGALTYLMNNISNGKWKSSQEEGELPRDGRVTINIGGEVV
jgi:hypothetical protein